MKLIVKLIVDVPTQILSVYGLGSASASASGSISGNGNAELLHSYIISTAYLGLGEQKNSFKTPRGLHQIRAKIGQTAPLNAVFVGRRWTGEIYSPDLAKQFPDRDWILTRILWLSGLEPGKNRLGNCDTMARYIYIHGCPDESPIGMPRSHGCIRMRNKDLLELYDMVEPGTNIEIKA